jgi:signal transduction histidine kinase
VSSVAELEQRAEIRTRGDDLVVWGDPDQLQQLLINLVRNAVDASPPNDPADVEITWKAIGEWIELSTLDRGVGLADTDNLFVPFFTTKPSGSGIGLALSRQIAEGHGGTLSLMNRPDPPGCRAVLRIPAGRRSGLQSDDDQVPVESAPATFVPTPGRSASETSAIR